MLDDLLDVVDEADENDFDIFLEFGAVQSLPVALGLLVAKKSNGDFGIRLLETELVEAGEGAFEAD